VAIRNQVEILALIGPVGDPMRVLVRVTTFYIIVLFKKGACIGHTHISLISLILRCVGYTAYIHRWHPCKGHNLLDGSTGS
jgi:hypothetical protein